MLVVNSILEMLTMIELFPDLEIDVIQSIFIDNDRDFERTFDQLLEISFS